MADTLTADRDCCHDACVASRADSAHGQSPRGKLQLPLGCERRRRPEHEVRTWLPVAISWDAKTAPRAGKPRLYTEVLTLFLSSPDTLPIPRGPPPVTLRFEYTTTLLQRDAIGSWDHVGSCGCSCVMCSLADRLATAEVEKSGRKRMQCFTGSSA